MDVVSRGLFSHPHIDKHRAVGRKTLDGGDLALSQIGGLDLVDADFPDDLSLPMQPGLETFPVRHVF